MARYFKLVTYTSGDEYETHEKLIDEPTFRSIKKALAEGSKFIGSDDSLIKVSSIKEIVPADDIVREYLSNGLSLKTIGLPETSQLDTEKTESGGFRKLIGD